MLIVGEVDYVEQFFVRDATLGDMYPCALTAVFIGEGIEASRRGERSSSSIITQYFSSCFILSSARPFTIVGSAKAKSLPPFWQYSKSIEKVFSLITVTFGNSTEL